MIFTVNGTPAAQGSKRAFVIGGKAVMVDADKKLKPWRQAVTDAAAAARGDDPLFMGPVRVRVRFVFPRPKSHYGTGRNAEVLKNSAPAYVATRPDVDKLLRAVFDALTGVVFKDDSQVAVAESVKAYGAHSMAIIEVTPLEE
jgi:crossover junction endodeoxyribonuclease RusA